ncbi:MAG TPA: chemotaxis protein CheW [bacterium]
MTLRYRQFYKPEEKEPGKKQLPDTGTDKGDKETPPPVTPPVDSNTADRPVPMQESIAVLEREVRVKDFSERSFAVFTVGKEWYAVDLDATLEILHSFDVVAVPHLPEIFSGVTNLRGESVPVVDLKKLMGAQQAPDSINVCLIMLFGSTKIGFLIDSEVEIVNAAQGKFYPLPDCFTKDEARFLEAVFWMNDRFIGLLKPGQALEVLTKWEPPEDTQHAESAGKIDAPGG